MPKNGILNPSRILISLFHATAEKLYNLCIKSKPILAKLLQLSFSRPGKYNGTADM